MSTRRTHGSSGKSRRQRIKEEWRGPWGKPILGVIGVSGDPVSM